MNAKLQIFVSSTFTDLRDERQAAVEAILKAGHIPAGMELFAAGDETQMEIIQRWIDDSDVYMLVLGGRYGTIHTASGDSYLEREYDYAVNVGKPVFATVITEAALEARVKKRGSSVMERDNPQKLKKFREKVLDRICSFFGDPKDIKLAVHETLVDMQRRYSFPGWVRGDALKQVSQLRDDLAAASKRTIELQQEVTTLSEQLTKAKATLRQRWSDDELLEVLRSLETDKIERSHRESTASVSVLSLVLAYRNSLLIGVSNQIGMSSENQLLFFEVFPKLEVLGLARQEKNPRVVWRTYRLNAKGAAFLAFLDRLSRKKGPRESVGVPPVPKLDGTPKEVPPRPSSKKTVKKKRP